MTEQVTAADGVIQVLKENGVEVVFGIPSIHNISLYDALRFAPLQSDVELAKVAHRKDLGPGPFHVVQRKEQTPLQILAPGAAHFLRLASQP